MKISDLERKLAEIRRERGDIDILRRDKTRAWDGEPEFIYREPDPVLAVHPEPMQGTRVAVVIIK